MSSTKSYMLHTLNIIRDALHVNIDVILSSFRFISATPQDHREVLSVHLNIFIQK